MATSEDEIRNGVILLINQYGTLTTKEIKKLLGSVMIFDDDDLQPGTSRSAEPLINQRIGNIVSHQKDTLIQSYYDAYQIDKTSGHAIWTALSGLKSGGTLAKISQNEINNRKDVRSKFIPKKIDWQSLNGGHDELGLDGEKFAMRFETNRVLSFAMDDVSRIVHLSQSQGDGAGFDILSLNDDGTDRYIEVKTTKGNLDLPFYMTENEKKFFELHQDKDDLFIYRVYNFDSSSQTGEVEIISADDLLDNFVFDPTTYRVSRNLDKYQS